MFLLLLARFLRPKHVWALMKASPPILDEVGGEFAGAKASVKFAAQGQALEAVQQRVAHLEKVVEDLRIAGSRTTDSVEKLQERGNP